MKFKKILLSLLICLSCFVQAKNITISRLTCEVQEGLVVVEGSPRLGWVDGIAGKWDTTIGL